MSDEKETKDAAAPEVAAPVAEEKKEAVAPAPAKEEAPKEEVKEAAPVEAEDEGADVEVPAKFKDLVEKVESMSVLDLNELVKLLEKKFGVSAVAAVAAAPGAGDAGAEDEQSDFIIHLADSGATKIAVIKVVKEVAGLGLKEAKDLVDGAPADVKSGVKKEEAEEIKAKLEAAGAKVELK